MIDPALADKSEGGGRISGGAGDFFFARTLGPRTPGHARWAHARGHARWATHGATHGATHVGPRTGPRTPGHKREQQQQQQSFYTRDSPFQPESCHTSVMGPSPFGGGSG